MDYTIADIENMTHQSIVDVRVENKWVVIYLSNGIRIKMRDWKTKDEKNTNLSS